MLLPNVMRDLIVIFDYLQEEKQNYEYLIITDDVQRLEPDYFKNEFTSKYMFNQLGFDVQLIENTLTLN